MYFAGQNGHAEAPLLLLLEHKANVKAADEVLHFPSENLREIEPVRHR